MSYTCGIGQNMRKFGWTPGPPHITCDGCGLVLEARNGRGGPPRWLLDQKAPRGWLLIRRDSGVAGFHLREDYCPRCRAAKEK